MKARYEKPRIAIEVYDLSTSIASGCASVVSLGPEDHEYNGTYYTVCEEFKQEIFAAEDPAYMNFFENCSCYLSAGVQVFTS